MQCKQNSVRMGGVKRTDSFQPWEQVVAQNANMFGLCLCVCAIKVIKLIVNICSKFKK